MHCADRQKTCLPLFHQLPTFAALDAEALRFLAGGCHQRIESRGRVLCEKGVVLDGLFCVLSGRVKLSILSEDGAERVLEVVLPGGSFGEASVFLEQPFPLHAEVLSDARLLLIGGARMREAVMRWPQVALALIGGLSCRVYALIRDLEACCLMPASRRVAEFLLRAVDVRGPRPEGFEVVLPAPKAVVASSLNLTAETFSRELHGMAREGLIEIERRTIRVLSLEGLRRRCASPASNRPCQQGGWQTPVRAGNRPPAAAPG